jgi:trehalose-6-phosphate synthase
VLLGVDRLDYTKGILHRLQAVEELYADGRLKLPGTIFVQVATPSRERVDSYRTLREEVEVTVGRINGEHARLGRPAVQYLHKSFPKEELVALYLAADVLLVTALRDGMNLVAKEYIASRHDEHGALVLSEFTGAAIELPQAYIVNPHDIEGLKNAVVRAATAPAKESTRRMRAMRRRVRTHDVSRWAGDFLRVLERSAAANAHLLEDLAGDDDLAVPAQAPGPDVDVELPPAGADRGHLADVGANGPGGEQAER